MISRISPRPRQGRLLPERRFAGPMPWLIAIMMFLTVLAAAAGLGLGEAAARLRSNLAGRITVQIVEADPYERGRQTGAVIAELHRIPTVSRAERVDPQELKALLKPWLGAALDTADVPMPDMIDIDFTTMSPREFQAIESRIRRIAPAAQIDRHAQWLAPLDDLIALLKWLAIAHVLLMAAATSFTVVLAARATLDNHRNTIAVMHLLGATDTQIARLFQRRIALDALLGGIIGFAVAMLIVLLLGQRMNGLGSELVSAVNLSGSGWAFLMTLPLMGTALAMATARLTILNILGRIL